MQPDVELGIAALSYANTLVHYFFPFFSVPSFVALTPICIIISLNSSPSFYLVESLSLPQYLLLLLLSHLVFSLLSLDLLHFPI